MIMRVGESIMQSAKWWMSLTVRLTEGMDQKPVVRGIRVVTDKAKCCLRFLK